MNRISKASVRGFRRPRAGEQGDESPPPAPPTLSSVPEFTRPMSLKRKRAKPGTIARFKPQAKTEQPTHQPTNFGCIGPSPGEEALACKASLRWHVDSATQAERQGD